MKKILLSTMPHTGTHTFNYLFAYLGSIEVYWHHWETNSESEIKEVIARMSEMRDVVFCQTYRDPEGTFESHMRRIPLDASPKARQNAEGYFKRCTEIFEKYSPQYPTPLYLPVRAPNSVKTDFAMNIFRAVRTIPTVAAQDYMESWWRINSYDSVEAGDKFKGFKDKESLNNFYNVMRVKRLTSGLIEEMINGS